MKKLLSTTLFLLSLLFSLNGQTEKECIQLYKDFKSESLKREICTQGLKGCKGVYTSAQFQTYSAAFTRFQNALDNGGCVEIFGKMSSEKLELLLACPADALITNSSGKQIGWKNGQFINDIGANFKYDAESEWYVLPLFDAYYYEITGRGQGNANLYFINKNNNHASNYFENIPLTPGIQYSGMVEPGGIPLEISGGGSSIQPNSRYFNNNDPVFGKIASIGQVSTNTNRGNVITQNNQPPTASFSMMPTNPIEGEAVVAVSNSSDPDGDPLTYEWYLNENIISRNTSIEIIDVESGYNRLKLVVADNQGLSSFKELSFNVASGFTDPDIWEPSIWDEIVDYAPYIAGGVFLLILMGIFNKKKNRTSNNRAFMNGTKEKETIAPADQQSTENKNEDGWVDVRYCTNCGKPVLKDQMFCGECGHKA